MVASIYIIKLLCTTVLINTVQLFVACAFTKPSFELTKSSTIYPKDLKLGNTLETSKIELKHGAVQQALDEDPASKAEQGTVDISHPNVKISTQSLGVANVGKKEKSIRNSGSLKDYSPLHWNTLHRNPIQAPTLSHLHQSERQYPGLQTSGSYHSLINPQYGSHIPTALPLIAQPVTIQEINYAGPVVIPTIYHNFAVSYRQAHLFTDARVYDGHSIQGALLDIPTNPWIPRNEAESQFRVDSSYKENRPAVRISKPLEKEKSEVLSKNKVGESTKETDIDKEKEKSSLLAEKNIQEYIHLKDKKKDDVAGELLNEQPKNQELKTSSTTNQIKIQNQVLNQLNSHSAPVGTSKQDLKDNKKVINLAKTLRKLDLEKSQSDHIKFSKGKTPVDNVPFSKTNGKGSADRIFQKTSEDDVRISAPVLETASKSQKDFKKQQLRPSTSKEMKLVPHEKDIKDFKSFGRFSFKTQKLNANNVINSLKSKDKLTEVEKNLKQKFLTTENEINNCEADSNAEPILSYKFTLLSPVPEQNKKNDLKYIPVLIEKPRVEKEETYQQTKQKLYDNEEFLESPSFNQILKNPSQLLENFEKIALPEINSHKHKKIMKSKQRKIKDNPFKTNVNILGIRKSEQSQPNHLNSYNSPSKKDDANQTSEKYKETKNFQTASKKIPTDEVQDKIDSVPIPNNYQVNSEEIGKSTGDLFEHLNKEKNIKNKYLIKENLEKSKISESSLSSYQKTNEVRSLQTETKNVDENQQAEASSIEKASQITRDHSELIKIQAKKREKSKNKKTKKNPNTENKKEDNDEISKILNWINGPGDKSTASNKESLLKPAKVSFLPNEKDTSDRMNVGNKAQDKIISLKSQIGKTNVLDQSKNYKTVDYWKVPGTIINRVDEISDIFKDTPNLIQVYVTLLMEYIFQERKNQKGLRWHFAQDTYEEFQKILYFSPDKLIPAFEWLRNKHFSDIGEFNRIEKSFYNLVIRKIFILWKANKIFVRPDTKLCMKEIFGNTQS